MICNIVDKYFLTLSMIYEDEKSPKDYGTGHFLYGSEINFIIAVNNNPESNAMELSKILNITRGAVTQYGNKLEKRGIIYRYFKKGNKKEKYYSLSDIGQNIIQNYYDCHNEANRNICNYFSSLSIDEKEIIFSFLDRVAKYPISKFNCNSNCCNESL